ncbi:unnamed protein product [Citrullus colocynthis]|uniref:Uncharacterized protein n=1 Tax=Citrullus colocynthis TaxID=252529 RepID=A0ABP0Z9W6_9ROSI
MLTDRTELPTKTMDLGGMDRVSARKVAEGTKLCMVRRQKQRKVGRSFRRKTDEHDERQCSRSKGAGGSVTGDGKSWVLRSDLNEKPTNENRSGLRMKTGEIKICYS